MDNVKLVPMVQRVRGTATGNEVNGGCREQIPKGLVFQLENLAIIEFCQIYTAINYKMHYDFIHGKNGKKSFMLGSVRSLTQYSLIKLHHQRVTTSV